MTPRESREYRRSEDRAWYWELAHFLLAPIVDHWYGVSLTRLIATAFTVLVMVVSLRTDRIGSGAVTLAVFAIATAFGKTVFTAALNRWGAKSVSEDIRKEVDTHSKVEVSVHEVVERRGDKDFEATP